jgi:uncharacterized protein YqgC (DUF456 family)
MTIAVTIIFALLGLVCLGLIVVGLPGTWILLGLAALLELTDHLWLGLAEPTVFGWGVIVGCVVLAGIGEALEFATGAVGTKMGGGNKRGMIGAFAGGMIGGLVGTGMLPIVGTLLGALVGTFAGALVGEVTGPDAKDTKEALPAAIAATIGRIIGTVAKLGFAIVIWVSLTGVMVYRLFMV